MTAPDGRRYGGEDPEERRKRRRAELVAAGLELFGSEGFANVSVKRVCDRAGLTQRYFYESFTDRPALLAAVYDDCVAFARAATVGAIGDQLGRDGGGVRDAGAAARAALHAFLRTLADHPFRARVILVEVVGVSPSLELQRLAAIHDWAELILLIALGHRAPSRQQRLAAIGLVGAVTQLLVDWYTSTTGEFADRRDTTVDLFELDAILDTCVELFAATHARMFVP